MDTLSTARNFSDLNLLDIFIGANGEVTLIAMMIFALAGNLYRKYQRFQRKPDSGVFNRAFWLKDNWIHMVAGFFVSYCCARLANLIIPFLNEMLPPTLDIAEMVIVVGIYIGYKLDDIMKLDKFPLKK